MYDWMSYPLKYACDMKCNGSLNPSKNSDHLVIALNCQVIIREKKTNPLFPILEITFIRNVTDTYSMMPQAKLYIEPRALKGYDNVFQWQNLPHDLSSERLFFCVSVRVIVCRQ